MKAQMKHTPGPWIVDTDRPSGQLVVTSEFGEIAQVFGGENPDDETAPNARLIAAAPSLLDACKDALLEFEALHEVMLLNPLNRGMKPAAIIGRLHSLITEAESSK